MDFGQKLEMVCENGMRVEEGFWAALGQWGQSLFVFDVCVVCRTTLHKMMGNFCAAWLDSVDLSEKDRNMIR